jgi:hypothetical protein
MSERCGPLTGDVARNTRDPKFFWGVNLRLKVKAGRADTLYPPKSAPLKIERSGGPRAAANHGDASIMPGSGRQLNRVGVKSIRGWVKRLPACDHRRPVRD